MIERYCQLLTESLATHQEWRRLIMAHSVQGVLIHDTRTISVMNVHGITHLLTFDKDDFKRFPGITALYPFGYYLTTQFIKRRRCHQLTRAAGDRRGEDAAAVTALKEPPA